jgi:hypothetical protein
MQNPAERKGLNLSGGLQVLKLTERLE